MAVNTLFLLVCFLIALGFGIFFLNEVAAKGLNLFPAGIEAKNIIGNPGEITYTTVAIPTPTETTIAEHIYPLNDWDPFRPSELACLIGDKIVDDYSVLGPDGNRTCFGPADGVYHYCFLDSKLFKLTTGKQDELAWESNLTSRECSLCNNGTTVVPELDEICLNADLNRTLETGFQFCHGKFPDPKAGLQIAFSNCWCFNANPTIAGWSNYCNGYWSATPWAYGWHECWNDTGIEFCDNEQSGSLEYAHDMVKWCTENAAATADDQYVVKTNRDTATKCLQSIHASTPNSNDEKINIAPFQYTYGLFWIPEKKIYYLSFERVPVLKKETNFSFLVNGINNFNSYRRFNLLGYETSKTRRVLDRVVIPNSDKSLTDLMLEIRDKLNEPSDKMYTWKIEGLESCPIYYKPNWNVELACIKLDNTCKDTNCIENLDILTNGWKEFLSTNLANYDAVFDSFRYYILKFNVDNSIVTEGKLLANKKYRVVLDNWISPYATTQKDVFYRAYVADKSIGIYPLDDEKINECCQGSINLSFDLNPILKGSELHFNASGINYCDKNLIANGTKRGTVYFYEGSCSGTLKGSCDISNEEETLYCLAGEDYKPKPTSCTVSFTAPSIVGDYTYYACTDKNGNGNFNELGESASATLTVISSCSGEECDPGKGTICNEDCGWNHDCDISCKCGIIEYLPGCKDEWTETDASHWISVPAATLSSDAKFGSNSIYGSSTGWDLRVDIDPAHYQPKLADYDKVHLWFKGIESSPGQTLRVSFYDQFFANIGYTTENFNYKELEWREYTLNLKTLVQNKPLDTPVRYIGIEVLGTDSGFTTGWVDNLYLCKNC